MDTQQTMRFNYGKLSKTRGDSLVADILVYITKDRNPNDYLIFQDTQIQSVFDFLVEMKIGASSVEVFCRSNSLVKDMMETVSYYINHQTKNKIVNIAEIMLRLLEGKGWVPIEDWTFKTVEILDKNLKPKTVKLSTIYQPEWLN